MKLKLGTRGSPLALAQTGIIAGELLRRHPGLEIETVRIRTSGDILSSRTPPDAALAPGGKGLFVKEIEAAILDGRVDLAVHSAKDLPADPPEGLAIAAYPLRADPRDVFIGREGLGWKSLRPGVRIGTSSPRRRMQCLAAAPGVEFAEMHGNVDTRLKRLEEGRCDGLILAEAGLRRLGLDRVKRDIISEDDMLTAPGQGALAVEARPDCGGIWALLQALDHGPTRAAVETERAFLRAMGGGCSAPLGAWARPLRGGIVLEVFYARPDGSRSVRLSESGPGPDGLDLAERAAQRVRHILG
ncbi:MAG: hydroxymethylbilane synthase [Elusimicrobiota bacterium]|jgi:hydroxymethylbilane synthase